MPARAILFALRAYKLALSPLFAGSCRFLPSCSDYMGEAVMQHGAARGLWLGLIRLARCHPFGSSGHDPVPARPESDCRQNRHGVRQTGPRSRAQ